VALSIACVSVVLFESTPEPTPAMASAY